MLLSTSFIWLIIISRLWIWAPLIQKLFLIMLSFSQIWVVAVLLCPELCVCTLCLCSLTLPGTHVLYKCQLMNVFDHLPPTSLRYTTLNPTGTSQVKDLATFLCTWSKTILGFLMHTFVNKKTLLFEWNFYQAGWVSQSQNCVTSLTDALVVSVPLLLISDFF